MLFKRVKKQKIHFQISWPYLKKFLIIVSLFGDVDELVVLVGTEDEEEEEVAEEFWPLKTYTRIFTDEDRQSKRPINYLLKGGLLGSVDELGLPASLLSLLEPSWFSTLFLKNEYNKRSILELLLTCFFNGKNVQRFKAKTIWIVSA